MTKKKEGGHTNTTHVSSYAVLETAEADTYSLEINENRWAFYEEKTVLFSWLRIVLFLFSPPNILTKPLPQRRLRLLHAESVWIQGTIRMMIPM